MDPLDILEKVNAFYSNAFGWLLTTTIALWTLSGVVLPILIQYLQYRSFRNERESIESFITSKLKAELEIKFQEEKELLTKDLESKMFALTADMKNELLSTGAGIFMVQGSIMARDGLWVLSVINYASAAEKAISGKDELNGRRSVIKTIDYMTKLTKESFDEDIVLEEKINKLLETLKLNNDNNRYTDTIYDINSELSNAKKRTKQPVV